MGRIARRLDRDARQDRAEPPSLALNAKALRPLLLIRSLKSAKMFIGPIRNARCTGRWPRCEAPALAQIGRMVKQAPVLLASA